MLFAQVPQIFKKFSEIKNIIKKKDNTVVSSSQNDIEIQNKFEEGLGIIKLKNLQSIFC